MSDKIYGISQKLLLCKTSENLQIFIAEILIPFINSCKFTESHYANLCENLIISVCKMCAKLEHQKLLFYMILWSAKNYEKINSCNILWHFIEWVNSQNSMLFEERIEFKSDFIEKTINFIIKCIIENQQIWLNSTKTLSKLFIIHYLNLLIFISESNFIGNSKEIFKYFIINFDVLFNQITEIYKISGIMLKLCIILQNILQKFPNEIAEILPIESYNLITDNIFIKSSIFTEIYSILNKKGIYVNFEEREKSIKIAIMLNLVIKFINLSYENSVKIQKIYIPFFDSHKENILKLMTISDSALILFLLNLTKLEFQSYQNKIQIFKTEFILFEYYVLILSKYGENEWLEMSINYLLEDADFLEFIILFCNYVKLILTAKSEIIKIKYSAVLTYFKHLYEKLLSYNTKNIFPYKLTPLINKLSQIIINYPI